MLHRPPGTPVSIVRHLLGVQAQDARAVRLALRARGTGFGAADVDAALRDGSLVIGWLMRGTLHLVAREDYGWLLALTAPRTRRMSDRRLVQLELQPARVERAVTRIAALLPATRAEIEADLGTAGQQTPHLLLRAALEGVLVQGADGYVPAPDLVEVNRDEALARLTERYAKAHAEAEPADLAGWSGLPHKETQQGLALPQKSGQTLPQKAGQTLPRTSLLGMYDEYLLGFKDRSFAVPQRLAKVVQPGGGIIRAVALERGRVVATWSKADPPPPRFADELADVERFFSDRA